MLQTKNCAHLLLFKVTINSTKIVSSVRNDITFSYSFTTRLGRKTASLLLGYNQVCIEQDADFILLVE